MTVMKDIYINRKLYESIVAFDESEEAWALEREIRMCMFERLRKEDIKP